MTRNFFTTNRSQRGFTLLEMIVVITIMSTLAAIYAPKLVSVKQRQDLAREVAKNTAMLIDAAKLFHYNDPDGDDVMDWPTIAELKSYGYINPGWQPKHAFGGTYSLIVSDPNLQIKVSSLPADVQNIVRQSIPGWTYTEATNTGVSTIPPPGMEPSIAMKVTRSGDNMWGDLIMDDPARIVFKNASGAERMVLDQSGLHSQGEAVIQSRSGTTFRNASGSEVASIDSNGIFEAKDVYLRNLHGGAVPLSDNRQWVVYTGIHGPNELVTAPAIGGGYSNAAYNIFVAPVFFEGAKKIGDPVYPITLVHCWAEKISNSPPKWRVRMYVKDSEDRLISEANNQKILVIVTATV